VFLTISKRILRQPPKTSWQVAHGGPREHRKTGDLKVGARRPCSGPEKATGRGSMPADEGLHDMGSCGPVLFEKEK
jgi:hypothetical protein